MSENDITRREFLSIAAVAGLASALALSGCSPERSAAPAAESADSEAPAAKKTLVAYYSATGNTREVAEELATMLDADLFEIVPERPYTEQDLNWREEGSRVNIEHEDPSQRDIALVRVTPDRFTEYENVLIGYPIWWAIAAWPVNGFMKGNDFSSKMVIPFCTSTSSGLGNSVTNLADLAEGASWKQGKRFSSSFDADEVREWAESLDL